MGLQLADAAAGAFFNGLERDAFGNTEPRYLATLSPLLYRHQGQVHGLGFKVLPKEAMTATKNEPSLRWLENLK